MTDHEANTAILTTLIEELADKYAKELDKQITSRMIDIRKGQKILQQLHEQRLLLSEM